MAEESRIIAVDSLVANEFEVQIDGETLLGIFRVEGLSTFLLDDNGERVSVPFRLIKMVQRDGNNVFNSWLRETLKGGTARPRRTVAIVAIDDGVETRRWTVNNAWIASVSYSPFDSASSEMVEEIVTIAYDSIEESWPATPGLE
ncbi:MAG: phage tail protein [Chloroflexota bacterium]